MLLPVLGGTPNVWITCLLFFQICLLGGYLYAHLISRAFSTKNQGFFHILMLGAGLLFLPPEFGQINIPAGQQNPALWILLAMLFRLGIPVTILAGTAPLLQNWFSGINHPEAGDPYFLYMASSLGSIGILLAYPTVIEPFMGLSRQAYAWACTYALFLIFSALCSARASMWTGDSAVDSKFSNSTENAPAPIESRNFLFWIVASAVPSSLLLGVTSFLSVNIIPVPLFWVIPMVVYLLTWLIAFSPSRKKFIDAAENLLPFILLPFALLYFSMIKQVSWLLILLHMGILFLIGCLCHGRLVESRPPPANLTFFYLVLSLGGVLGSLFNSLFAPMLFSGMAEYPLMLVFSGFFLVGEKSPSSWKSVAIDFAAFILVLAIGLGCYPLCKIFPQIDGIPGILVAFIIPAFICFECRGRPSRFGLTLGAVFLILAFGYSSEIEPKLFSVRNFFGIKQVIADPASRVRELVHGTTTHGSQSIDPAFSRIPLAYYHPSGPAGDIFEEFNRNGKPPKAGIIGMGAGSMAFYAQYGQEFIFYEIDPDVVRLACNEEYFTFIRDCQSSCDIILGDGRLNLQKAQDNSFGLIILDAFNSDVVPAHLLTREALRLYIRKLHPRGFLAFHISNRYIDLEDLLSNLANEAGLICCSRFDVAGKEKPGAPPGKFDSHYLVMARSIDDLKIISKLKRWEKLGPAPGFTTWTDDFFNPLSLFEWQDLFDS